ncbi:MAG: hypothetical protein ACI8S3_000250 [Alphaproteobacteria bacterium]|jgi:hypothetical protein
MRIGFCAAISFLALISAAGASERLSLAVPGGLAALERETGVEGGISPPAGTVVVVRLDGKKFQLSLFDGKLTLSPSDTRIVTAPVPDMLPDGEVTQGQGAIRRAWLTGPTERYDHGILGDRFEASGVGVERADGKFLYFDLGDDAVFEDRRARLYDFDGDGADEVIVVKTYLNAGAALAVLEATDTSLELAAEAEPIGQSNRWLNPAGAGDFDGDGRTEVAYVETPHIGGTLRLYEYNNRKLTADGAARGFSNHAIGTREQDLAAVADWNGDGVVDLLVPDSRRQALRIVTFAGGEFKELERIKNPHRIVTAVLPARLDQSDRVTVVYGLADGTLVAISPSSTR